MLYYKKRIIVKISIAAALLAVIILSAVFSHAGAVKIMAKKELKSEISLLQSENYRLEKKQSDLKDDISDIEEEIDSKNEIADEAAEYIAEYENLKTGVDEAEKSLSEINASIERKQTYLKQSKTIKRLSEGEKLYASDETLKCPSDIPAGRYIASGDGNLLVYNTSNSLRLSENLESIETNSFTFDISAGESVKAAGSATLTELK